MGISEMVVQFFATFVSLGSAFESAWSTSVRECSTMNLFYVLFLDFWSLKGLSQAIFVRAAVLFIHVPIVLICTPKCGVLAAIRACRRASRKSSDGMIHVFRWSC